MALFKRRLRSPKGWNEIAAVVIEMQEVLERFADTVSKRLTAIAASIPETVEEPEPVVLMDEEITTPAKINLVFDAPLREISVMVVFVKDIVRGTATNNIYAYQGSTPVGRLAIASGTVTVAEQVCRLRCFEDNGYYGNWYLNPGVSATAANYTAYTQYTKVSVDGGITKVTSSAVMPAGARVLIVGVPMGEG